MLSGLERGDIVSRTGGAVDKPEKRVEARAGIETRLSACRAYSPAVLRLMATKTGASIGPQVLKERVTARQGGTARLVGRNQSAGIGIDAEFRDDERRRLGTGHL